MTALLLVDVQPDFMPGGALAIEDGDGIVAPIIELMARRRFECVVATQDWHPPGHVSFASQHAGAQPFDEIDLYGHPQVLWPDHCVQGSPGAALHPDLPAERIDLILRKGADPRVDSYSAFRNNWDPDGARPVTGLSGYLRDIGVNEVFICGLARDVCVKWTAEDAATLGFETTVLWDLTRAVDPSTDADVRRSLAEQGIAMREQANLD